MLYLPETSAAARRRAAGCAALACALLAGACTTPAPEVREAPPPVVATPAPPEWIADTVHIGPLTASDFAIPASGAAVRVIELVPDQLLTGSST